MDGMKFEIKSGDVLMHHISHRELIFKTLAVTYETINWRVTRVSLFVCTRAARVPRARRTSICVWA